MSETSLTEQKRRQLLEAYLQKQAPRVGEESGPLAPRPPGSRIPLTSAQKQLWLHAQLAADTPLYNEPLTVRRKGALDPAVLERSFTEIVRRHEAWRTAFPVVEGQPVQVVNAPFEVTLPLADLCELAPAERETAAMDLASEDARLPFNLAQGPLFRARLVRLGDEEYRLFVTLHHLIFDGFSGYRVFLPELSALYESFSCGEPSSLPALPFQFADYALWQQARLQRQELDDRVEWWKRQLAGASPALELPMARPQPATQSFSGAMHSLRLPEGLSERLRRLSQREGVTLFMTLLAAFNILLHRYSAQEDILIGSNSAGRDCPDSEKLLGYFLNTVVLRTDLSGSPTFRQVLERVRKTTLDALANDGVPLERLVAELQPQRDRSRNPFFQVLFSLEPPLSSPEPGWDLTCIDVETGTTKFELCLVLDDRTDGLLCRFIYSTALFDEATISRMSGHWQTLLEAIVDAPEQQVSEFPLLTEPERDQVLVAWNHTSQPEPQSPVHQRFELQAQKTPQAVAVECATRQLSYRQLDEHASQLAKALRSRGVGPDVPVAICVERSVEMIVGILGILKAGGAYVALDPAYPRERLEFILADCQAPVLLTQSSLANRRLSRDAYTILLDSDEWRESNGESTASRASANLQNLAYIIYTSGSTGGPKGVLVTHGNLAHSNHARLLYYTEPMGKGVLLSSYAFDSSVAGIFHALTSGGTLVIPPPEFHWRPEELAELIAEKQISWVLTFPGLYGELLDHANASQLTSLRTVIVAGEACTRRLVNSHCRVLPRAALFNEYGPTEATVWSSVYECEPGETDSSVPIGRPIPNTRLYVLDRNRQPVPVGIPGELYVAGAGVTRGYLNRPDLTQLNFVPDPFAADKSARLYRTGDLVRYWPDGNLDFLGRLDQQVKIHGLRIEPGEIEAILAQHPDVREAVVAARSSSEDPQLVAFVISREERATSGGELRAFLKNRLPTYMVPAAFHFVSAFPHTPNGKVDRQRLLLSGNGAGDGTVTPVTTPRNDIEKRLLAIWQRVLKTDSQDVTRDFFEMGGHSLLAAQLLAGIEKEFGKLLSLAFVFQAPSIEQMAESMRSAGQSLRDRAIVPIQPKGSKPPLFWIRGGPRFRLLAQKLGPDQPFLGLDLPYVDGSRLPAPYQFEDIAALLLRAMREEQPYGPYHLAGLCVNAVLAYEVARQLVEMGAEVALLALFDGHNQAYYKSPFKDGRYSGRIKYHFSNLLRMGARETPGYLLDRLDEARRKIERIAWQWTADGNGNNGAIGNTDNIVHPAFHRYEPQPYPAKMVLLQSSDWPSGPYFDFRLGWNDLVPEGIEFHWIPGDHPSMFTEPNVNLVADRLRGHLAQANSQVQQEVQ